MEKEFYYPGSAGPFPPRPEEKGRPSAAIHVALFVATFLSASLVNSLGMGADVFGDPSSILVGFPYAITLMSILLAHEMGHYLMARVHRVDATLPYFIPAPIPGFFIGTFGAFIRMRSVPRDRQALFDIGAAGPWGGFLVAVPALIFGLQMSEVTPIPQSEMPGFIFGESALMKALQVWILDVDLAAETVHLHPVAFAAWVGFLVTALNLLPIGQLDGGHVIYAAFGEVWHRWISRAAAAGLLILGVGGWPGWLFWVALLALIGFRHPRTDEAGIPLSRGRKMLTGLTVVMFAMVFMPEPIFFNPEPIILPAGELIEV